MHADFLTRAELIADGMSRHSVEEAVRSGELIRARRDRYVTPDAPEPIVQAVRVGGQLTCLSLLELHGVYVLKNTRLHVHMKANASRMRSPDSRWVRLADRSTRAPVLHWTPRALRVGQEMCAPLTVALAHSVLCQGPRAAVASIDSALHRGIVDGADIAEVFSLLPQKFAVLRPLIDSSAESGPETFMRLILRSLGCGFEAQVVIGGVGRVDFLVDGWLVVECDSRAHHSEWAAQVKDRERDLALAALGYARIRPTAAMITETPGRVAAAVVGMLKRRR
ncbi:type IV toxin-antitoxin system AbiEi family antitoxin domain-containing protein [Microbacterium sediminicola]|uniref:type IV toxin-antitoxin system AbiEi family antitoxin domain-containing protein n=1 Tax=Microbacterium sediminicola TaxID=415210 RepID=UPI0031DA9E5C